MKKLRIICVTITALIALLLPDAAFAQNASELDPGPEWNITIEFRYSKGEESSLNVPNSIERYGRTYHLVSKTSPVLEKNLPATREYTWLIEGTVTEAERNQISGMENLELIPTNVEIGRVDDQYVKESYPTNDVEDIDLKRMMKGTEYTRAAVRFEVEEYDKYELPISYEAEIVYRGIEKYMGPGYKVKASYTTSEDLDGVPQYVVVATYAPDGLVPITNTGGGEPNATTALAGGDGSEPTITAGGGTADIGDGPVPQASGDGNTSIGISPLALVLIIIAAVIGGFIAWMFLTRRRFQKEKRVLREERRRAALRSHELVEYDV